ncbi:hypothetical protein ABFS82_01G047200 [Erythranthe guttata]|uniref:Pectin acetylesterase n=2 Tax=Erythranthe guttata TaxID=4155 RepID=A0A022RCP2_ERYGU|nr:PREDICTED: pectin acetylesterase 8-like [Erythranthe guttata]EYU37453.1 hypothetical protein MIMGU_mgv1a007583mg [Erythranthe guttata]|eukprot:XP_012837348.1 PREDICTED: pectin acetylesterase 8-like [Erythranthe guttata]
MGIYIPTTMADHWLKLLICVIALSSTKVNVRASEMVNITLLSNAVEKGAVCLDGSPAGYHYAKGYGDGANSWMIYLPGGGWCGRKQSCIDRVKYSPMLSSTKNITQENFGAILSPNKTSNPDFYNWNRVFIRYCDGSSFMGDVKKVDPETNLHKRGSRIFTSVIDELLSKGLKDAKNVMLTGNSAGGLATILNCDRFRALVPNANMVKCVSDSGFFIHAKNLPNAAGRERTFSRVVHFHGISKFLPKSCTSRMKPGLCFFPENLVAHIKTPLFLLNSDFDKFQIQVNLKPHPVDNPGWVNCTRNITTCTPPQLQIIKDFRNTFLETLKGVGNNPSRGLFINSCYIHDFLYLMGRYNSPDSPKLHNKTIAQAIGDWYFNRSSVRLIDTKIDYPLDCKIGSGNFV